MLILFLAGLTLNIGLVWITGVFDIPLYLDSIGTVLVAVLGGMLPGIAVGFLSNSITSLLSVSPDPMTLYYGFLNVLLAMMAAWLSQKGLLRRWYGQILAVVSLSLIGGGLGFVITWMLYGFTLGQGASAALANTLLQQLHLSEFSAQLVASLWTDLADKLVTVAILDAVIWLLPQRVLAQLPLGYIYAKPGPDAALAEAPAQPQAQRLFRRRSIRTKITLLIMISSAVLSILALTISVSIYRSKQIDQYSVLCGDIVSMMLAKIDGDRVEDYLSQTEPSADYEQTKHALHDILDNAALIKYMYVYAFRPDGRHVVFDLDAADFAGESVGTVLPYTTAFPHLEQMLAGEADIPPSITNGSYGWLLTAYKPVYNAANDVVAYAAADIDMQQINTNLYSFSISIASLLFGVMIVIAAISLRYGDKGLLEPMSVLVEQARSFRYADTPGTARVRDRLGVKTGDELEEIFDTMCRTEDAIAKYVSELTAKTLEISLMQRNIIYTLANMVENRDGNTGGHIKRTASYVQLIGRRLMENGLYGGRIDEEFVKMLAVSAPLHDIGKIKIPDAVLNKPGKLTDEEFALMKTHTTQGAAILRASLSDIEDGSWLSMAIAMAEYHHERWDGSGYPKGLSGEGIPLCARIMAVSDVFDALISKRSYKPAYSLEDAIARLQEGAGSHFDPQIVAVFTGAEAEIRRIIDAAAEKNRLEAV